MQKPKHKEPTNYEHCCSCCPILEAKVKELESIIEVYRYKEAMNS